MGILDSKNRILDTIVTEEGRKQISEGDFRVRFAAFSDKFTFYEADAISGSADASARLYFEATSLPQDRITFDADDAGQLRPLEINGGTLGVFGGKIVSGTTDNQRTFVTGSAFASLADELLEGSLQNFDKLRVIATEDLFLENNNFTISDSSIDFSITRQRRSKRGNTSFKQDMIESINLDDADNLFQDQRLSHIQNFRFLPPRNRPNIHEPKGSPLGYFSPVSQQGISNFRQLKDRLREREFVSVKFSETSQMNNLICQFFEKTQTKLTKLDVIDFGSFSSRRTNRHVFFVGKILLDSFGRHTFINIFTLIFE